MKIKKVKKDSYGDIKQVMLSNGDVVSIDKAIKMASKGQLEGYNVGKTRDGSNTLRANADSKSSNNLSNLPTFE